MMKPSVTQAVIGTLGLIAGYLVQKFDIRDLHRRAGRQATHVENVNVTVRLID
jgi:hypothetical protein